MMDDSFEYTHLITPDEAFEEYCINDAFREQLDAGCYVYAEGMYVINHPNVVCRENGQLLLTEYARENLSECALSFEIADSDVDLFSRQNFDESPKIDRRLYFNENGNRRVNDDEPPLEDKVFRAQEKIYSEFFLENPDVLALNNAWEMIGRYIDHYDIKRNEFIERSNLTEDDYKFATGQKKGTSKPTKQKVITFAFAYFFNVAMAAPFLEKAGRNCIDNLHSKRNDKAYTFVLGTFAGHPMETVNDFLKRNNFFLDDGETPLQLGKLEKNKKTNEK